MKLKSKTWISSLVLLTVLTGCFLFYSQTVQALGISPPGVMNRHLLRGSHFEQTVYINQGDPKEPLHATAQINVPEQIKDWITLEPGKEFTIPVVRLFPVFVAINVPPDAELGSYGGEIKIIIQPEAAKEAQVMIGVAVVISLDLVVVEEEIIDFSIAGQRVQPMEEGWPVKLSLMIDNRGNTKAKPDKVYLEVYDRLNGSFLGSSEAADFSPDYALPFQKSEITAEFSLSYINLPVGSYWAQGKIYKSEGEVSEYKFPFEVLEKGALPRERPWVKWLLIGLGGAALLGAVVWRLRRFGIKILNALSFVTQLRPAISIKRRIKKQSAVKKKIKKTKKKVRKVRKALRKGKLDI